ncbi:MAG: hypothetical protein NZZ41_02355 [Candidatus Dojkabacteria bacterium]|nr:hypothetical protein [Candidatus Dojkabacteria bacterium]
MRSFNNTIRQGGDNPPKKNEPLPNTPQGLYDLVLKIKNERTNDEEALNKIRNLLSHYNDKKSRQIKLDAFELIKKSNEFSRESDFDIAVKRLFFLGEGTPIPSPHIGAKTGKKHYWKEGISDFFVSKGETPQTAKEFFEDMANININDESTIKDNNTRAVKEFFDYVNSDLYLDRLKNEYLQDKIRTYKETNKTDSVPVDVINKFEKEAEEQAKKHAELRRHYLDTVLAFNLADIHRGTYAGVYYPHAHVLSVKERHKFDTYPTFVHEATHSTQVGPGSKGSIDSKIFTETANRMLKNNIYQKLKDEYSKYYNEKVRNKETPDSFHVWVEKNGHLKYFPEVIEGEKIVIPGEDGKLGEESRITKRYVDYFGDKKEVHARLSELRYDLRRHGITEKYGDSITLEDLKKLQSLGSDKLSRGTKRLFTMYQDNLEELVLMLNTLAKNTNVDESNEVMTAKRGGLIFKRGGVMPKYKGSGTKDACYEKVKARYKVFPSAYASGALSKCRKIGAKNWGNSK